MTTPVKERGKNEREKKYTQVRILDFISNTFFFSFIITIYSSLINHKTQQKKHSLIII